MFPIERQFFPKEGNFLDEYNNISQSEECFLIKREYFSLRSKFTQ
jgi:hypothetical protein